MIGQFKKGMNYVSTEVITTELMKGLWTNSPSAAVSTQYNTLFTYVNTYYLIFQIFSYVLSNFGTFLVSANFEISYHLLHLYSLCRRSWNVATYI